MMRGTYSALDAIKQRERRKENALYKNEQLKEQIDLLEKFKETVINLYPELENIWEKIKGE